MTSEDFLNLLREHGFHIGDGIDNCSGSDVEAEEESAKQIFEILKAKLSE